MSNVAVQPSGGDLSPIEAREPAEEGGPPGLGQGDWVSVTLAVGQSVDAVLAAQGIRPTPQLRAVIAERNSITDFGALAVGREVWLPRKESVTERPEVWREAARSVNQAARRAVELDRDRSRRAAPHPAAPRVVSAPGVRAALRSPQFSSPSKLAASGTSAPGPATPSSVSPVAMDPLAPRIARATQQGRDRLDRYVRELAQSAEPSSSVPSLFEAEGFAPRVPESPRAVPNPAEAERDISQAYDAALALVRERSDGPRAVLELELEKSNTLARLAAQTGNTHGVMAAYGGGAVLPKRMVVQAGTGKRFEVAATTQELAALGAEGKALAPAALLALGRAFHECGTKEGAAAALRVENVLDRLARADKTGASSAPLTVLRAYRLSAEGQHLTAAQELSLLRRELVAAGRLDSPFVSEASRVAAATLSAGAVSARRRDERERCAEALRSLRRELEQSTLAGDVDGLARLLVLEATAFVATNRGVDARQTLDALRRPPYSELPWVRARREAFVAQYEKGELTAAVSVLLSEAHGDELVPALTSMARWALTGGVAGMIATRSPVGLKAGMAIGASVGLLTHDAGNIFRGASRIVQAYESGLSASTNVDLAKDAAFVMLDATAIVGPVLALARPARAGTTAVARAKGAQRAATGLHAERLAGEGIVARTASVDPAAAAALRTELQRSKLVERLGPYLSVEEGGRLLTLDIAGLRALTTQSPDAARALAKELVQAQASFRNRIATVWKPSDGLVPRELSDVHSFVEQFAEMAIMTLRHAH